MPTNVTPICCLSYSLLPCSLCRSNSLDHPVQSLPYHQPQNIASFRYVPYAVALRRRSIMSILVYIYKSLYASSLLHNIPLHRPACTRSLPAVPCLLAVLAAIHPLRLYVRACHRPSLALQLVVAPGTSQPLPSITSYCILYSFSCSFVPPILRRSWGWSYRHIGNSLFLHRLYGSVSLPQKPLGVPYDCRIAHSVVLPSRLRWLLSYNYVHSRCALFSHRRFLPSSL